MTGYMVYYRSDNPNQWYIDNHIEHAKKRGISLMPLIIDDFQDIKNVNIEVDFAINKTRDYRINDFFERKRIICLNNKRTVITANDKWKTFLLCKEIGVPVINTKIVSPGNIPIISTPHILKNVSGHGGSQVYWVNNDEEIQQLVSKNSNQNLILQDVASSIGMDVRAYVIGGKPIVAVKRESDTDFRSNYSLGGKVSLFNINNEQRIIINKICSVLNPDYVGIDFIYHNGDWVLNEIEDAAGSWMLEGIADFDICELYIDYIGTNFKNLRTA